jgi:hypothetical protein
VTFGEQNFGWKEKRDDVKKLDQSSIRIVSVIADLGLFRGRANTAGHQDWRSLSPDWQYRVYGVGQ